MQGVPCDEIEHGSGKHWKTTCLYRGRVIQRAIFHFHVSQSERNKFQYKGGKRDYEMTTLQIGTRMYTVYGRKANSLGR